METKDRTSYLEFRDFFEKYGYLSINQARLWKKDFNVSNLGRWAREGKLVRLKQGYYTFPSFQSKAGISFYLANKIYAPSYVSLQSALAFYGMIPEYVFTTTSVTTLKTFEIRNPLGLYSYQSIKRELFFGHTMMIDDRNHEKHVLIATPEKALLDYLYLHPHHHSRNEMIHLRLDPHFMKDEFNWGRCEEYIEAFRSKVMNQRIDWIKEVYG